MLLSNEMKKLFHIGIWLAVLVIGVWVVGFIFRSTCQGGTGNGLGFFRYSYEFHLYPAVDGDPSFSYIELEAQAPQRFKLYGGVSPMYDTISMKWKLYTGYEGRKEGHILIKPKGGYIVDGGRRLDLTIDNLLSVTGITDRPANRITFEYLLGIFAKARTGHLPRPSPHAYIPEEPMIGRIQHVARGYMLNYSILSWVSIWLLIAIVTVTKKRITRRRWRRGDLRKTIKEVYKPRRDNP